MLTDQVDLPWRMSPPRIGAREGRPSANGFPRSTPRLHRHKPVLSPVALTFALTGAPLLRVHVERVVSFILTVHVEPGLEAAAGLPVAALVASS